jgi:transcriptional regulator with XRE-family HTH domain
VITSAQCRAARALLDWSGDRLATRTGLNETELNRFEAGDLALSPQGQTVLKRALEEAGAVFFDEDETVNGGPGVRLRKTRHDEGLRPDQLTTENDG